MFQRILLAIFAIFLAVGILAASIFRSASPVSYAFNLPASNSTDDKVLGDSDERIEITYYFPYPGKILPDSPFWPLKALRDKIWIFMTRDLGKRAELKLLCADKRLISSRMLFEKDKPEIALSTLTKAEKYLEEAVNIEEQSRGEGSDTSTLLLKLSNASLKHQEVINEILEMAPSDAKPEIIKTRNYSERAFEKTRQALNEKGMEAPENPFEGEN